MFFLSEYLKLQYNVVIIEYTELSQGSCYTTGIENSLHIAKCATKMVEDIVKYNGVNVQLEQIHIIGLSLGVEIAGQMPNYLTEDYKFSRITGKCRTIFIVDIRIYEGKWI